MRLLVLGRSGQLATELARAAPGALCLGRSGVDLSDVATIGAAIREHRAEAVVNAAAWTAVDAAEAPENRAAAENLNARAPGNIALATADAGVPLVHVSTDYVFDGGAGPYHPGAPTAPLGVYGTTKRDGERTVQGAGGTFGILRTSWVFSAHGANFVKTMLRLAETRDRLSVVADQRGGPTPAADLATACIAVADALRAAPGKSGIYHYTGAPDTTWADFARAIFAAAKRDVTVEDIATADYPTPAARPADSRLDCTSTKAAFGLDRPDWRAGLARVLKDLEAA